MKPCSRRLGRKILDVGEFRKSKHPHELFDLGDGMVEKLNVVELRSETGFESGEEGGNVGLKLGEQLSEDEREAGEDR